MSELLLAVAFTGAYANRAGVVLAAGGSDE
jgi:hypothetical protein